jgi:L-amino acid N-acyltransferase YncA
MQQADSFRVLEIYRMGFETRNAKFGFRIIGKRERIARLDGKWRDTILLERRSSKFV